jgi:hypothetical protein
MQDIHLSARPVAVVLFDTAPNRWLDGDPDDGTDALDCIDGDCITV